MQCHSVEPWSRSRFSRGYVAVSHTSRHCVPSHGEIHSRGCGHGVAEYERTHFSRDCVCARCLATFPSRTAKRQSACARPLYAPSVRDSRAQRACRALMHAHAPASSPHIGRRLCSAPQRSSKRTPCLRALAIDASVHNKRASAHVCGRDRSGCSRSAYEGEAHEYSAGTAVFPRREIR